MPIEITMPALSPTMTEGNLAKWTKKEGDKVVAGDVIAEIETDKATMEVEAVDEGVLGKILVADGTQGVKVNDPIAVLVEEGEDVPAGDAKPAPKPEAREAAPPPQTSTPTSASAPTPPAPSAPAQAAPAPNGHDHAAEGGERIFASPLARRMARQAGIDLSAIKGSG